MRLVIWLIALRYMRRQGLDVDWHVLFCEGEPDGLQGLAGPEVPNASPVRPVGHSSRTCAALYDPLDPIAAHDDPVAADDRVSAADFAGISVRPFRFLVDAHGHLAASCCKADFIDGREGQRCPAGRTHLCSFWTVEIWAEDQQGLQIGFNALAARPSQALQPVARNCAGAVDQVRTPEGREIGLLSSVCFGWPT